MKSKNMMVPMVAGVIIRKNNKYLLVQEKKASVYGLWNFPAGHVDVGESIEEAAIRETKEEVGYEVKLIRKIFVDQKSVKEPVKHVFYAETINGQLEFPEDEILDANWFSIEEIKKMKDKLRDSWVIESIEIFERSNMM